MKSFFYKSLMTSEGRFLSNKKNQPPTSEKIWDRFYVVSVKNLHEKVRILVSLIISKLFIDTKTAFLFNQIWGTTSGKKDIETNVPATSITREHS